MLLKIPVNCTRSRLLSESAARKTRVRITDTLMGRVVQSGRPIMMSTDDLVRVQSSFLVKSNCERAAASLESGHGLVRCRQQTIRPQV